MSCRSYFRRNSWGAIAAFLLLGCGEVAAEPRAARAGVELRLCSQNLFRFNVRSKRPQSEKRAQQKSFLVTRMLNAKCDVVAAQEVAGRDAEEAGRTLAELATELSERSGRNFSHYVGDANDRFIRNGFLIATDVGRVVRIQNYGSEYLPRLGKLGPSGRYIRSPIGVQLEVPKREGGKPRQFFILNIHSKSKARDSKDASGTKFELLRMEMAEGFREILARERRALPRDAVVVMVGDRNSDVGSASARILEGNLRLEDFRAGGGCRLDSRLEAECRGASARSPQLVGLFAHRRERDRSHSGSIVFRGREELIDEIAIPPEQLPLVTDENGRLAIGFEGQFYKGSDHKLLHAAFDF